MNDRLFSENKWYLLALLGVGTFGTYKYIDLKNKNEAIKKKLKKIQKEKESKHEDLEDQIKAIQAKLNNQHS